MGMAYKFSRQAYYSAYAAGTAYVRIDDETVLRPAKGYIFF